MSSEFEVAVLIIENKKCYFRCLLCFNNKILEMRKIITILFAALLFGFFSYVNNTSWKDNKQLELAFEKAGENIVELKRAINEAPKEQKEAVIFLIENMPQIDLQNLSATFILENTALAYISSAPAAVPTFI